MFKRVSIAVVLGLAVAALLATFVALVIVPAVGDTTCPVWEYPVQVASSLAPGASQRIECINASGQVHAYRNPALLQWSLCFGPTFLLFFPLAFFNRRIRRLSGTG
jgi:hypothetical protein